MVNIFAAVLRKGEGIFKRWRSNQVWFQRRHWKDALARYDWNTERLYGNEWGDPENSQDRLGDYQQVKQRLMALVNTNTVVLEIGSLAGKWVQFLVHAKKIICVDINDLGFKYIRQKLPHAPVEFYLTRGDELRGIAGNSVDLVFSMDTLVRVPKGAVRRYFKEIRRVLKPSGRVFIHLPCTDKADSRRRAFVPLTMKEILQYCSENEWRDVRVDKDVIHHGIIVEALNSSG